MSTVILEIKDDYLDKTLEVLNALKGVMIEDIKIKEEKFDDEKKDFIKLSNAHLNKVWDNKEDSIYDRFLK
jgi:hypothetical protein